MPVRVAALFLLGALAGSMINLGCYRLAWNVRGISPWSPAPAKAPPRSWRDRLPILGWQRLRRESEFHGSGFWIRPMLVELAVGVAFVALYEWTVGEVALLPAMVALSPPAQPELTTDNVQLVVHVEYLSQICLLCLLAVATLIDMDEKTIPDGITIPGTLLGLAFAAIYPWSLLPAKAWLPEGEKVQLEMLTVASPNPWPGELNAWPGLLLACGCWWAWCLAIQPLRWRGRRGWRPALRMVAARVAGHPYTWASALGTLCLAAFWYWAPAAHWAGLLTALVGMAAGGGLIWAVRIIGSMVLEQEAMGFGDVTLMAMIGTFVGWQNCPLIFFLAPFVGAIVDLHAAVGGATRRLDSDPPAAVWKLTDSAPGCKR
jgi:prepilin signal peptidase PulO-like enzyme (type II secretory pathway)